MTVEVVVTTLAGLAAVLTFLDAQRFTDREWRQAGSSLLTWTLIIVLIPAFGPAAYLATFRRRLAARRLAHG